MAQTTGAISPRENVIETSPDNAVWTDRSGVITKLTPGPGTRKNGQTNTFGTPDTAIITVGQRPAVQWHVDYLYTEVGGELFEVARAAFEAATDFYIRFKPKGGQTGEFIITTLVGKIVSFDYPPMDANSGDPVMLGFDVLTGGAVKSVAP